jgi:hypothetical protein
MLCLWNEDLVVTWMLTGWEFAKIFEAGSRPEARSKCMCYHKADLPDDSFRLHLAGEGHDCDTSTTSNC